MTFRRLQVQVQGVPLDLVQVQLQGVSHDLPKASGTTVRSAP